MVKPLQTALGICAAVCGVLLLCLASARFWAFGFPLELASHFQGQYFLAAAACAAVLAAQRRWRALVPAAAAVAISGGAILPYGTGLAGSGGAAHAGPAAGDTSLRLLLANVHYSNQDHERVLRLVSETRPDVFIAQEVNARWMDALQALAAAYPHVCARPRQGAFGVVAFSRLPLDEAAVTYEGSEDRPTLVLRLTVDGSPLSIVATHPLNPLDPRWFPKRNEQLTAVGDLVAGLPGPAILIGDLNTTMWSPWYGRLEAAAGLRNARSRMGLLPSWPSALPAMLRIPIDQCLVSEGVTVRDVRLGPAIGSDHLPLVVDVVLPGAAP